MLKKIICFLAIIGIIMPNIVVLADDELEFEKVEDIKEIIQTASKIADLPSIDSKYAVVIDRNSKKVLYGKKENEKTKMASTTKIMTAIVVLENSDLEEIIEVSLKAANIGGSKLKFKAKDKISVKDLLYGLMLRSGNDAAIALSEHVGKDVNEFVNMMNKKAEELGLENTKFESPHGLDSNNHYTTAYELAILTDYALKNEMFKRIVGTQSYTIKINGNQRIISNTNELLGNLVGVYGVKTGFTNGAGRCLVTAAKREELDIICVVLGADTKKIRTTDSIKLIEYTFKNFENIDIKKIIEESFENWANINSKRINIEKGKKNGIKLKLDKYNLEKYPIKKGTQEGIDTKIKCDLKLKAPVGKDTQIGELDVIYDNKTILMNESQKSTNAIIVLRLPK